MNTTLSLAAVVLIPCQAAPVAAPLERARALAQEGKHAEALAAAEALRKQLPPDARLTRWELDFEGRAVPVVLVGNKHLFVTLDVSRGAQPDGVALPDKKPALDDRTGVYDFDMRLTCLDAATGARLWGRRTPGRNFLALDDRTDHLYVWREKLFRLDPKTGEEDKARDLPKRPSRLEAVVIAGRPHFAHPSPLPNDEPTKELRAYKVETGEEVTRDLFLPLRMSPDEKRVLGINSGTGAGPRTLLTCRPFNGNDVLWKYEWSDHSFCEPFWLDNDVAFLAGEPSVKSEVVRLDGTTGKPKWRFELPRGAYGPGRDQLPGNAYPERSWSPLGMCAGHLLAIGGEGSLYFLDPDTGKLKAKASPATSYLAFPRVVDGGLVVASIQGVRSIPLDVIFRRGPDERDVALLQAKCLDALGRPRDAEELLGKVLERDPDFADGWALRAEVCRKLKLAPEEIAARCRHLELAGQGVSPELRERWGLLKRVATGNDVVADLKSVGDMVYVGTRAGWVHGINVRSLESEKKEFPLSLNLLAATTDLKGHFGDWKYRDLARLSEADPPKPVKAPPEWGAVSGYDGAGVRRDGKHYRPLGGGNVRVLDGDQLIDHKTVLKGIKSWQISVSPAGVVGYGESGVFELDEALCPVRRMIGRETNFSVLQLADNARTLGMLVFDNGLPSLQVWTRDGKTKVREESLAAAGYIGRVERLIPLGDGYLLCAHSLTWVPASADGPAWRFGFGEKPGRALPKVHFAHTALFGRPLVKNNMLFVSCRDGAVYVFDVGAITRPKGS